MTDLIKDLGLVPKTPEPDPCKNMASWCSWFRDLTHCDLRMAMNAVKRRREEWEEMYVLTKPRS